jgi:hypothetical protein
MIAYDDIGTRKVSHDRTDAVNVIITDRVSGEAVGRYEIHLAGGEPAPSDRAYFDGAWERAVSDGLVNEERRTDYGFQLQRPKTLYESSQ